MKTSLTLCTLILTLASGCSFYARGADDYKKATRKVLETRQDQISSCYQQEIAANDQAAGNVTVKFDVEAKTGKIVDAKIVEKKTTASEPLKKCVLDALADLKLDPPDQRTGKATFVWEFSR